MPVLDKRLAEHTTEFKVSVKPKRHWRGPLMNSYALSRPLKRLARSKRVYFHNTTPVTAYVRPDDLRAHEVLKRFVAN